jgi:hypothetical protein
MKAIVIAAVVASVLAQTSSVFSHHSQTMYEPDKKVTIEGVVTRWVWTNPHTWLFVDLKLPDGSVESWGFEANSAATMQRAGWRRNQFTAGDKVTVTGWPMKNGEKKALLNRIVTASGETRELNGNGPQIPR